MRINKCFECNFPTKESWAVVPGGKPLPLCRLCQGRIPKELTKFELLVEASEANAKKSGRAPGRPRKWDQGVAEASLALLKTGLGVRDIAKRLGFSYATTWKYLRKAGALP